MQNISDLGLTPPFHVKQTAVYPLIVDSRGVSVAFVCMSEHMDKIARLIAESLEGAADGPERGFTKPKKKPLKRGATTTTQTGVPIMPIIKQDVKLYLGGDA